ncbi:MAG: threonylcarbamoyl-AMP synthase [Candidatus Pacebacteria bacterium]|nr:threonylcarbamoyl-AMP synthase [Candidatus Paceibacterota bacterium]
MEILKVDKEFSHQDITLVVNYLKKEKVVAMPTDTIYGFSAKLSSKKAVNKIFTLKKRAKNKQFIVLVSSLSMLKKYCIVNTRQEEYLKKIWPGKVTAILSSKVKHFGNHSLAVRLPESKYLLSLIRKVKEPIISTSCNISGEVSLLNGEDICSRWKKEKEQIDLIIFKKDKQNKKASKIVDITDIEVIKIIRK